MDIGRVAIVTGGGQGIGKAVAKKLPDEGWRVVYPKLEKAMDTAITSVTPGFMLSGLIVLTLQS